MEITYNDLGDVFLRKDDGTEVDLLKLEGALTMAQTSREFNRKRAEELDDRLHRIRAILDEDQPKDERVSNYPSELDWATVRAERDRLRDKVVRREKEIGKLEQKVKAYDEDRHTERDRADQLSSRADQLSSQVKVMEREVREKDAELRRRASAHKALENRYERLLATLDNTEDSVGARDRLLSAATTRLRNVRGILSTREVEEAEDQTITRHGVVLANAIKAALAALED